MFRVQRATGPPAPESRPSTLETPTQPAIPTEILPSDLPTSERPSRAPIRVAPSNSPISPPHRSAPVSILKVSKLRNPRPILPYTAVLFDATGLPGEPHRIRSVGEDADAPNEDEPDVSRDLEGLLNHHTSQLQKLADRVHWVNEWIECDWIVMDRMAKEVRRDVVVQQARYVLVSNFFFLFFF